MKKDSRASDKHDEANGTGAETSDKVSHARKRAAIICGVVAAIIICICIGCLLWARFSASDQQNKAAEQAQADAKAAPAKIAKVDKRCDTNVQFSETATDKEIMVSESGGKSLTLLSGKDSSKTAIDCVLENFGMPSSLREKILNAKMDDGLKTERWKGMDVTWIYNDNSGLQLTVEAVIDENNK